MNERSLPFIFTFGTENTDSDIFVARVAVGVSSKEQLLDILAKQLRFPDYYGRNWDAFEECLRDLSWVKECRVWLVHEALPIGIGEDNLKTYIEILANCLTEWQEREEHEVTVAFPEQAREAIINILKA